MSNAGVTDVPFYVADRASMGTRGRRRCGCLPGNVRPYVAHSSYRSKAIPTSDDGRFHTGTIIPLFSRPVASSCSLSLSQIGFATIAAIRSQLLPGRPAVNSATAVCLSSPRSD